MIMTAIQQAAPAGQAPGAGALIGQLLPFVLIGLIFYFLLIRPQSKRLKEHKAMIDAVQRGDEIVTNGGLVGKVKKVNEDELLVTFGGNDVKVVRAMINNVRSRKPAND